MIGMGMTVSGTDVLNSSKAWIAAFGEVSTALDRGQLWNSRQTRLVGSMTFDSSKKRLYLIDDPAGWSPVLAEAENCRILFDGNLYNRSELQTQFTGCLPVDHNDADLVMQAYFCWGEEALHRVKGIFALLIQDNAIDLLLCARDPFGMHPLFYADTQHALLLSPSIDSLLTLSSPYQSSQCISKRTLSNRKQSKDYR